MPKRTELEHAIDPAVEAWGRGGARVWAAGTSTGDAGEPRRVARMAVAP